MLDRALQFLTMDLTKHQLQGVVKVAYRGGVLIHIAFACGYLAMFGLPGFAGAGEISGLRGQVARLSAEFQKDQAAEAVQALELQIKVLDQEIFQIEAKLAEFGRLGQQADMLYAQRLSTLKSDKAATERRLDQAMKHPALVPPDAS